MWHLEINCHLVYTCNLAQRGVCVCVCVCKCTVSAYNKAVASYFSLKKLKLLVNPLLQIKRLTISLYRVIDPSDICLSSFLYLKWTVWTHCGIPFLARSWENSTLSRAEGWSRAGVPAAHCLVPLRVSPSNPSEMSLIKCGQVSVHGHCLFHSSWLAFHSSNLRLQTQAFRQSPLYISHCKSRLSETPSSGSCVCMCSCCGTWLHIPLYSLLLPG